MPVTALAELTPATIIALPLFESERYGLFSGTLLLLNPKLDDALPIGFCFIEEDVYEFALDRAPNTLRLRRAHVCISYLQVLQRA